MKRFLLFAAVALMAVSCTHKPAKRLLPSVSGKAGEVIVVMDKTPWEGNLGVAVRELLASDCPYLAQREPLYTLVNVVPSNFVNLFQVHRNIVIVDVNPQVAEEKVEYLSDIWSHPQCVIRVSAATDEGAIRLVQEHSEGLVNALEQAERDRVIGNTMLYEERSIYPRVCQIMGGSPHFPSGYKLRKSTSDFVWVSDDKQTIQGVLMYKFPALGTAEDFSDQNLLAHRNAALKDNVPGMFDGTYMTTSEFIPPTVSFVRYKGRQFAQMRGFWEVYNDYMGGPFVSHSFYSRDGKDIIVLDAFVYAPKYDKRQYLRQVESLLYSFEWAAAEEKEK